MMGQDAGFTQESRDVQIPDLRAQDHFARSEDLQLDGVGH